MTSGPPRRRWMVPRPTGWHLFVSLLMLALATEYWDKDPLTIGGVQLPWPRFLLALCALLFAVPHGDIRRGVWLRLPAVTAPLMVFWACCALSVLSVLVAPGPSDLVQFVKTFAHLSMYVVFVGVVVKWITWPRLTLLLRAYYMLGVVAAGFAVIQWLHGTFGLAPGFSFIRLQSAEYHVGEGLTTGFRAASFFGEPSWAARYYVHFLAMALGFWWSSRDPRHLAAIGLLLLAFYTANSLLGYVILGTFLVAVVFAQMWRQNMFSLSQRKRVALSALFYVGFLVWLAGYTPELPDLLDRSIQRVGLVLQGGGGAGNRIDSVFAGLEVWKLTPIAGVGLGNIDNYIVRFYQDPAWVLRSRYASDSLYVQVLAETGVVGLLAFLWFWANLVWYRRAGGSRIETPESVRLRALLRFLQVDLVAQAVGMLNSSDYLNPHLWTVVAIVLSAKMLLQKESRLVHPANLQAAPAKPLAPVYAS